MDFYEKPPMRMLVRLKNGRFIILSVALAMGIVAAPQLAKSWMTLLNIGWRLTLVCALLAALSQQKELWIAMGVAAIATSFEMFKGLGLHEAGLFLDLCVLFYASFRILRFVFRGRVNTNTIFAAVCVYLMLGQIFAQGLAFLSMVLDRGLIVDPNGTVATMEQLVYFSYTTLTTTGLGDFRPITPLARTIVAIETLAGELFMVLLVGRLVGLHVSRKARHQNFNDTAWNDAGL